jgi:hypothetical protein
MNNLYTVDDAEDVSQQEVNLPSPSLPNPLIDITRRKYTDIICSRRKCTDIIYSRYNTVRSLHPRPKTKCQEKTNN